MLCPPVQFEVTSPPTKIGQQRALEFGNLLKIKPAFIWHSLCCVAMRGCEKEITVGQQGPDSRKYPRLGVDGTTEGRANGVYSVQILDITLYGALIEHTEVIRPGSILNLECTLAQRQIKLRCYVVQSLIHRRERQSDGEEALLYHTQLEFLT